MSREWYYKLQILKGKTWIKQQTNNPLELFLFYCDLRFFWKASSKWAQKCIQWQHSFIIHYILRKIPAVTGKDLVLDHQSNQKWYFVTKIVLTYCEKNCSSDQEKLLKFEAEGQEFAKILRSLEHFQTVKVQNNLW